MWAGRILFETDRKLNGHQAWKQGVSMGGDRCEWCVDVWGTVTPSYIPASLSSQPCCKTQYRSIATLPVRAEKPQQWTDLPRVHMVPIHQARINLGFVLDCNSWIPSHCGYGRQRGSYGYQAEVQHGIGILQTEPFQVPSSPKPNEGHTQAIPQEERWVCETRRAVWAASAGQNFWVFMLSLFSALWSCVYDGVVF